ncbi:helix-turn-helix domain-containing protein [Amycolatopsis halotolerans]|uniref:Helix-turn-helix domain-containing protein n=1 Tax=Amycolatopsis halotolerans TaxID=330083 RepID=A0ABV7Q7N9_9PSEU
MVTPVGVTARELFLEHGYAATALTQVARQAGVAPRTVYVRFGTKAASFRRGIDEALVGDAEPEIAEAAQSGRRETARLCREFWSRAGRDGLLASTMDIEQLASTTDALLCADTIVHLRRVQDWAAAEYGRWLRTALVALCGTSG